MVHPLRHLKKSFFELVNEIFRPRKSDVVYALVGASGTGKSYNAKLVAARYELDAIIDDGLLIQADKILAGHSAKSELSFLSAVRVALFDDKEHRDEIARKIRQNHIRRILILGTSEKMVMRIAARLQLPPPSRIIKIDDVVSKAEIELALKSRQIEGKHVIPVASNEVKKRYPKIFSGGIRFRFHRVNPIAPLAKGDKVVEKSIVQPAFSVKSRLNVSEAAIIHIAARCIAGYDSGIRVKKITVNTDERGYRLIITMDVPNDARQASGQPLTKRVDGLQKEIIRSVENSSGAFIEEASIIIDKVLTQGAGAR